MHQRCLEITSVHSTSGFSVDMCLRAQMCSNSQVCEDWKTLTCNTPLIENIQQIIQDLYHRDAAALLIHNRSSELLNDRAGDTFTSNKTAPNIPSMVPIDGESRTHNDGANMWSALLDRSSEKANIAAQGVDNMFARGKRCK
eukprot:gnl/TRDRNA2_/TRDRNA2_130588_c2_seq1.p1 gnl/TRDRNA2_/TRDRNA2_130588_c2~~gnl/TRDRNA2_/TRDRNA2_130588_c2_seq1.p1  ORF type:complete len:142 (+),score=23.35 gnl/TRDRNA2_/TRDRNA2_130588_c2_seq1:95-520(+)